MDRLSSCYFCGAALDASLDEYPVIPKSLHPDPGDQQTVVLCQGCREKLGTIVETVVEAAEADGRGESRVGGETTGTDSDARADAGNAPSDDASDDEQSASEDEGSKDVTYSTSTAAGGRRTVSGEPESLRDDRKGSRADDRGTGENDERGAGGADDDGDAATGAGDSDGAADGQSGEAAADDGPSMTALEYNKVMRLVQNREFPVDKGEIRSVATNAYQISDDEFDAVIDAAVSRGLIAEENGQLVSVD